VEHAPGRCANPPPGRLRYASVRGFNARTTWNVASISGNSERVKILFFCGVPFGLTHGGAQIQIEQTKIGLENVGVEVEWFRWWDDQQTGDVLQYFGRIPTWMIPAAHTKGMKVAMMELLTGQGSRSMGRLRMQKWVYRLAAGVQRVRPGLTLPADSYRYADACMALTEWEKFLMIYVYGAAPEKTYVTPNGVEDAFFESQPAAGRSPWLVCTATITGRKRVLELAQAAIRARTPVWVIGKPYSETDGYARRFIELARQNPQYVRYEGPVSDRRKVAEIYRAARGFVLISAMESMSLSALEAAACHCPLLLSDLPWARSVFNETASYCPATGSVEATAAALRRFYDAAPDLKPPPKPLDWKEVGQQFKTIYEGMLRTSR